MCTHSELAFLQPPRCVWHSAHDPLPRGLWAVRLTGYGEADMWHRETGSNVSSPPRTKKQGNERLLLIGRLPSIITLVSFFNVQHLFLFFCCCCSCFFFLRWIGRRHTLLLSLLIKIWEQKWSTVYFCECSNKMRPPCRPPARSNQGKCKNLRKSSPASTSSLVSDKLSHTWHMDTQNCPSLAG